MRSGQLARVVGSGLLTIGLLMGVLAQVRQEWMVRYNGYGNAFDIPIALAVDSAGNVYVAGQSDALFC